MYLKNLIITFLIFCSFIIITPSTFAEDKIFKIDIKTYLSNIRQEFIELSKTKEKDELPLYIDKFHIEMNVVVKLEGEGKVKFYVVDVGGKIGKALTQKLSFDAYLDSKPGTGVLTYAAPHVPWTQLAGLPPYARVDLPIIQEILDRLKKIEEQLKIIPEP